MATRNYAIMMTLAVFSDPKTRSISVPQFKNGQVPVQSSSGACSARAAFASHLNYRLYEPLASIQLEVQVQVVHKVS
jgi:hypothetical protein